MRTDRLLRPAAIVLGSAGLLAWNVRQAPSRQAESGRVEVLARQNLPMRVRCSGTLEARNVATLRSEVGGRVARKHVREGDPVRKGQLLLELDEAPLLKELAQERDNFQNAGRDYRKAREEARLQRELFKFGAVARRNIADADAALEKAAFGRGMAARNLREREDRLRKARLYSPMDGFVIKDLLREESVASPDKEAFVIGTLDLFAVRARVDEVDIAKVRVGQRAEIRVQAFAEAPLRGVVARIAPQAEREGYAKVDVGIDLPEARGLDLKPNLSVEVEIQTGMLVGVVRLPVRAVSRRDGRAWVWALGRGSRPRQVAVELGEGTEEWVAVQDGLKEGARVLLP